jgi:hypothetical protein
MIIKDKRLTKGNVFPSFAPSAIARMKDGGFKDGSKHKN